MAVHLKAAGNIDAAIHEATRAFEDDPASESVCRELMELLVIRGDLSKAAGIYRRHCQRQVAQVEGALREGAGADAGLATELVRLMSVHELKQKELATLAGTTRSYVSDVARGTKLAPPSWLDKIADAVGLDVLGRERLHRAAARDRGYKI